MKTFEDLTFAPHALGKGYEAFITIEGVTISVIYGSRFFKCGEGTYEMWADNMDAPIGYMTVDDIDHFMEKLQTK